VSILETGSKRSGAESRAVVFEVPRGWAPGFVSLEFDKADIVHETSDAIVNPAGPGLVDLAIRRAAGPELTDAFHACTFDLPSGKLAPGDVFATPGFRLPAQTVIHCRPPVYADGALRAREQLAACHVSALRVARQRGLRSLSFPAIGTGVFRYPACEAAEVATLAVITALRTQDGLRVVRFVFAGQSMRDLYAEAARRVLAEVEAPPSARARACETASLGECAANSSASSFLG
jgi:O-acetyl-ADP-ribose deacetylase (regulator of RNase III)